MSYAAFNITSASGILHAIKGEVIIRSMFGLREKAIAVWDTGASNTCISKRIVQSLKIIPIGMSRHNTTSGTVDCMDYVVDVLLPNGIALKDVRVSDFAGGKNVDVLIGMDIICAGDMSITNALGKTMMSYRIPSSRDRIDYVRGQGCKNKP